MTVLVFDLKTIPDIEGGRRLYNLNGLGDKDVAEVMYHRCRQSYGHEKLPIHQQRIAILSALLIRDDGSPELYSWQAPEQEETQVLSGFFALIDELDPLLVSWNRLDFHQPVLTCRAMVNGVVGLGYWQSARFHSERWIDPRRLLVPGALAGELPLAEFVSMLGYPNISGCSHQDVWNLYLDGQYSAIREACELEVLSTYLVYLRLERSRGHHDTEQDRRAAIHLQKMLEEMSPESSHFSDFLKRWNP